MEQLIIFKKYFDPLFLVYLKKCVDSVVVHYPDFSIVGEQLIMLARDGKRLRPYICNLAYKSEVSTDKQSILPVLFALELFQLFALIHDDILDNSNKRHGVETLSARFGLNQALLAGNQCLIWAIQSINGTDSPDYISNKVPRTIFLKLAEETNIGQMIDTSLVKRRDITESILSTSIELKTARYTFVYPALLGLALAVEGHPVYQSKDKSVSRVKNQPELVSFETKTEYYQKLGHHLGHAFQRLDDLSDLMASEAVLGKSLGSDITADLPTHLSLHFDNHSTAGQKAVYSVYRGQPLDTNDICRVRELFTLSGSLLSERMAIAEHLKKAEVILEKIEMSSKHKEIWLKLVAHFKLNLSKL